MNRVLYCQCTGRYFLTLMLPNSPCLNESSSVVVFCVVWSTLRIKNLNISASVISKASLTVREAVVDEGMRGKAGMCVCLHLTLKPPQSSSTLAAPALIPHPADLHTISSEAVGNEWVIQWRATLSGPSQWIRWPLTWLGRTRAEALPLLLAAEQPAKCISKCVFAHTLV